MRTILLSVFISFFQLLMVSVASAAISGSDDFDDNVKDDAKWSSDRVSGSGVLTETGQHLEYTSANTSAVQYSYRPWKLNKATYDTNWEVVVDLTNTAEPSANRSASIGLEVFAAFSNFSKSVYLELYAAKEGSLPVERGFESYMVDGDNYSGGANAPAQTAGSIRLTFDASSKVLTFYRDEDGSANGYQWTRHASYGIAGGGGTNANAAWGLTGSDELTVNLYGFSDQIVIGGGLVYADNFSAASSTSVTTNPPTHPTNASITLNATVFPNGMDTGVVFQIATDEDFLEYETTALQVVPGASSGTSVSAVAGDLSPLAVYWVRAVATNAAGTFTGNTVTFTAPPYYLTIDPTVGTVTRNPVQETYAAGSAVTLTATAPPGSTFTGWSGDVTGMQNPVTIVMDRNKQVRANFTVSISIAADSDLVFTTGGAKPWFGQTGTSYDGGDAVQSGAIGDSENSWFQTVVSGSGQISFWVKISSEGGDVFEFFIDNVRQGEPVGGTLDWQKRTYNLGAGTHTLRWQYRKDIVLFAGADAAWVDGILFEPIVDFNGWRSARFTTSELNDLSVSGAAADPDKDGVANLMEFALGGEPKNASARPVPDCKVEEIASERYLTMTITKPSGISGITYIPQVSDSLGGWLEGAANVVVMINTSSTLKVRDSVPMGGAPSRFIRLMVSN